MEANWTQTIKTHLAEVPPGTLVEVSPNGEEHPHPPAPHWTGRGRLEHYPLFPGAVFTHLWVLGESLPHRHAALGSGLEITHCRLGRVGWDLRDGMSVYLGEGDLSLHSADCCADSVMHFPAEMYAGLMICVDLTHLAESPPPILAEADFQAERLAEKFCGGGTFALPAGPELEEIFRPLYRQPEMRRLPYLRLKLQELLLYLEGLESGGRELTRYGSQQTARIQEIHALLTEHLDRRYTIEELSHRYLLNTSTLKEVFKAVYGLPIATYMKEFRVRQAMKLLRETNDTIADIASQVGYQTQGKFSSAFQSIVKMSPREYRKIQGIAPLDSFSKTL